MTLSSLSGLNFPAMVQPGIKLPVKLTAYTDKTFEYVRPPTLSITSRLYVSWLTTFHRGVAAVAWSLCVASVDSSPQASVAVYFPSRRALTTTTCEYAASQASAGQSLSAEGRRCCRWCQEAWGRDCRNSVPEACVRNCSGALRGIPCCARFACSCRCCLTLAEQQIQAKSVCSSGGNSHGVRAGQGEREQGAVNEGMVPSDCGLCPKHGHTRRSTAGGCLRPAPAQAEGEPLAPRPPRAVL